MNALEIEPETWMMSSISMNCSVSIASAAWTSSANS